MDGFENPGFLGGKGGFPGCGTISHISERFNQNPPINQGTLRTSRRSEKAASNLKGGLGALLEGLEHSFIPCAEVLSVAGLLDQTSLFLPGKEVIPEAKEAPFCTGEGGPR